jgi:hypothetical protein
MDSVIMGLPTEINPIGSCCVPITAFSFCRVYVGPHPNKAALAHAPEINVRLLIFHLEGRASGDIFFTLRYRSESFVFTNANREICFAHFVQNVPATELGLRRE